MGLSDGQGKAILKESKRLADKYARPSERENAVAECCLAAVEAHAAATKNLEAYMATASRWTLLRMLKTERARPDYTELPGDFPADSEAGSSSDHGEILKRLDRALGSLDHPCRTLLMRRCGLGGSPAATLKEIAAGRALS
jgi:DNA-directed RNA polymerase specialized sigma24 family protein